MEPSDYHLPPTHPVSPSGGSELTQPAPLPLWYDIPPIPPPPPPEPKRRKHFWSIAGLIILLLGVGGAAVFAEWAAIHPVTNAEVRPTPTSLATQMTSVPTTTPIPQPTIDPNYTASDIVRHMQTVDNTVAIESTDKTIWTFSHDNYFIDVHATSSVQFTACPLQCADTFHFGLWVYASSQEAQSAWRQVAVDSQNCTDTSPASSGMYVSCGPNTTEAEYAHGRCLLLNANDTSVYGQIVTHYCV